MSLQARAEHTHITHLKLTCKNTKEDNSKRGNKLQSFPYIHCGGIKTNKEKISLEEFHSLSNTIMKS